MRTTIIGVAILLVAAAGLIYLMSNPADISGRRASDPNPPAPARGGADNVSSAKVVRIGISLGLTGKYRAPSTMQQRGYELWQSEVNRRGGLLGKPVELIIVDDQSSSKNAARIYRELITQRRVDLLFGPYSSEIAGIVAPVIEKHGYPTLLPGAAADRIWEQGYRFIFGLFIPASKYSLEMLRLAVVHDLQRVAIVHANDGFSVEVANGARRWAQSADREVVLFEEFEKGTHELGFIAQKACAANADLLLVAGHFDEAVDMRRALASIDWYPRAYFATIGPTLPKYTEELQQLSELTFATSLWEPDRKLEFPGSREFIDQFEETYRLLPSYHAANAYAAGQVMEAAVAAAGSLDHNKIQQALFNLDVHVAIGRFRVDRFGVPVKHRPFVIQWLGGEKTIVYPDQHRGDARPVFSRKIECRA